MLPSWSQELIHRYASGSAGTFVLHGNIHDRLFLPLGDDSTLSSLPNFLAKVILPQFDVILTYDLGEGIRALRGQDLVARFRENKHLPHDPVEAIRYLHLYLIYLRNLTAAGQKAPRAAVIIKGADQICPNLPQTLNYDLAGLASLLRSWTSDVELEQHGQAAFLLTDNLTTLHPLVAKHPSMATLEIPLPSAHELQSTLQLLQKETPKALQNFPTETLPQVANRLTGATLSSVEELLRRRHYDNSPLTQSDLSGLKKTLVERDCGGLIDFIEPSRTLDDVIGLTGIKDYLRQDLELWQKDALEVMPMGYLFCGPVGTGKTYLATCLAGEAGVPVVVLKNFRSRWVGSTESNLEKIFALLHALGRCIVFIDEADQSLGQRTASSGDSGVSSRIYSMMAQEMSRPSNRGKILWILASSRPDLIEVDLKRPGRIDVKIPIYPLTDPADQLHLLQALTRKLNLQVPEETWEKANPHLPNLLTAGAAEALAVKAARTAAATNFSPEQALLETLQNAIPPIPEETLRFQTHLAAQESTEKSLTPPAIHQFLES